MRYASLELVVVTQALQPTLHPELALDEVRRRLSDGERAVADTADGGRVRISLPMRAQFRGGRTWIQGAVSQALSRSASRPKPQIAAAMRRAHLVVRAVGASPLRGSMLGSVAPVSTYEARLARLAYLSPELQLDLLRGRHGPHLTVDALIKTPPPLFWSDQKDWLERL